MTTTEQHTEPAAWIGCLACYNNGELRGKWITAQQAADEMNGDQITYGEQAETITTGDYTAPRCRKCGGDEFDVFDTEHLPAKAGKWYGVREFYENAEQLAALDDAGDLSRLIVLAELIGFSTSLNDLITYDTDNYVGQYNTFQDYAEQYADDIALFADVPEHLAYYFDMAAFARDLEHDYYHDDTTGHTWHSV